MITSLHCRGCHRRRRGCLSGLPAVRGIDLDAGSLRSPLRHISAWKLNAQVAPYDASILFFNILLVFVRLAGWNSFPPTSRFFTWVLNADPRPCTLLAGLSIWICSRSGPLLNYRALPVLNVIFRSGPARYCTYFIVQLQLAQHQPN